MSVHTATRISAAGEALESACGPAAVLWADPRRYRAALARRRPGRAAPKSCLGRHFGRMQEAGSGGAWPRNPPGRPRVPLRRPCRGGSGVLCGEKWPPLLGALSPPRGANLFSRRDLAAEAGFRARVLCGQKPPDNTLDPPKTRPPECYAAKSHLITKRGRGPLEAPSPLSSATSRIWATPESGYYVVRSRHIISPTLAGYLRCSAAEDMALDYPEVEARS